MNKKLLFNLVALVAAMMCALSASAAEAYACYTPSNTTLTFYYDNQRSTRPGTIYLLANGTGWFNDGTNANVTKVVFNSSFANARPTSTWLWFYDMGKLESITGINYLNTSEVTNMAWMFADCVKLTSIDLSNFNTSKVTNMSYMFRGCERLTSLDVSNFNTSKVTDMESMFGDLTALTSLDVRNFNTANVTNMSVMFCGCDNLTSLDVSNFNTSKVTDMSHMFRCKALKSIDLSNFNTSNVTKMSYMFYNGIALTSLDLSSFNTSKVTEMWLMFAGCSQLKTIYVSDGWSTAAVTASGNMFNSCTSLVGGKGTTFDANHVDAAYAHIDGGPSNPGYFTELVSLDKALNVAGGNIHFVSTGTYPWQVAEEGNRKFAMSGNAGVHSSTSEVTATVTVNKPSIVSFDFKAWGEGSSPCWDECVFYVDDEVLLYYGALDNNWEWFSVDVMAGTHTLKWLYSKDSNVHPTGDYFAVDNVAIRESPVLQGDCDGDGNVTIGDVSELIDYLLSGGTTLINMAGADCDYDGSVNIGDVSTLIDYLLSGHW